MRPAGKAGHGRMSGITARCRGLPSQNLVDCEGAGALIVAGSGTEGALMGTSGRPWRALASVSGIVVGACLLTACSSAERQAFFPPATPDPKDIAAASAEMPANYRVLVAEQIRAFYRY